MEMPEDKVRKVLKIAKEPISMETPIGDDEDSHLGDFIEDTSVASPIDQATMESLRETTHSVLAQLTPREAKVLRMRFGIDMNTDHTLEEVGKQFDVTRERIRQSKRRRCASCVIPAAVSNCAASHRRLMKGRRKAAFCISSAAISAAGTFAAGRTAPRRRDFRDLGRVARIRTANDQPREAAMRPGAS